MIIIHGRNTKQAIFLKIDMIRYGNVLQENKTIYLHTVTK
jgi:hypothetical protein